MVGRCVAREPEPQTFTWGTHSPQPPPTNTPFTIPNNPQTGHRPHHDLHAMSEEGLGSWALCSHLWGGTDLACSWVVRAGTAAQHQTCSRAREV